jgi:selenocysteine-specific elongation factor
MAGGIIVDPHPTKHRRYRSDELEAIEKREGGGPIALLREAVAEGGLAGVKPKDLVKATSLSQPELDEAIREEVDAGSLRVTGNGRSLSGDAWRLAKRAVLEEGNRFRERHPLRWGMAREDARAVVGQNVSPNVLGELLDELVAAGDVRVNGDRIRVGVGDVVFEGPAAVERDRVESAYRSAGLSAPDLKDVLAAASSARLAEEVVGSLVDQGDLVKITDQIYYHRDAWDAAHAALRELEARDGSITVGAFRDHLQISRKYAVPVLEMFDVKRVTRRDGDTRRLLPASQ